MPALFARPHRGLRTTVVTKLIARRWRHRREIADAACENRAACGDGEDHGKLSYQRAGHHKGSRRGAARGDIARSRLDINISQRPIRRPRT